MNDVNAVILFLQTLHYRDDFESQLFQVLQQKNSDSFSLDDINNLFGKRTHPDLASNIFNSLRIFGVISQHGNDYYVEADKLSQFTRLVAVAKASRDYKWPGNTTAPSVYISPPSIITNELSGEIDDISNLLVNLVSSATESLSIMSPYINRMGLSSILSPLKLCKSKPIISVYLTISEDDFDGIFNQIKSLIPEHLLSNFNVFYCRTESLNENDLPHAKLLIVDSSKGYLGSANFTRQGLTTRFEVGVKLDEKQSKSVEKLFELLKGNGVFVKYNHK